VTPTQKRMDAGMTWPEHINEICIGDCRAVLREIPDGVVQTCITSPPYWGLRDYGTATWQGGDPNCNHRVGRFETETPVSNKQKSNSGSAGHQAKDICPKCGAVRQDLQLGLEQTPDEYVANMVEVFSEVKRVLRDDGTLWLNLGDSYAGSWGDSGNRPERTGKPGHQRTKQTEYLQRSGHPQVDKPVTVSPPGCKPKDLVGIPWMVAFALRADGWYLRSDIIWSKPNPMPESVTDRPTKAHEYIFLMSKNAKYYYDADAITEAILETTVNRYAQSTPMTISGQFKGSPKDKRHKDDDGKKIYGRDLPLKRNKRSVWTVATQPFPGAHFATFPERLIEPCILAGSKEGDIVLDPFGGKGTVAKRSKELGRKFVHIDLGYEELSRAETAQEQLL